MIRLPRSDAQLAFLILGSLVVIGALWTVTRDRLRHERFSLNPRPTHWRTVELDLPASDRFEVEIGYAPKDYRYSCLAPAFPGGHIGPSRFAYRVHGSSRIPLSDDLVVGRRCTWTISEVIVRGHRDGGDYWLSIPRHKLLERVRDRADCSVAGICFTGTEHTRRPRPAGYQPDVAFRVE